jgi:2-dehydro-3-deoxygluconokinase
MAAAHAWIVVGVPVQRLGVEHGERGPELLEARRVARNSRTVRPSARSGRPGVARGEHLIREVVDSARHPSSSQVAQRVAYVATRLHGICTPVSIGGVTQPPEVLAVGETMVLVAPALAEPLETGDRLPPRRGRSRGQRRLAPGRARAARRVGRLVGDDALGRRLVAQLAARGVDTTWVHADAGRRRACTSRTRADGVRYYRSGSGGLRAWTRLRGRLPIDGARLLHLSGITPRSRPRATPRRRAVRTAAPPASRELRREPPPALWPSTDAAARRLRALAARADLVFVGLDEAAALWGAETADDGARDCSPSVPLLVVKGRRGRRDGFDARRRASTCRRSSPSSWSRSARATRSRPATSTPGSTAPAPPIGSRRATSAAVLVLGDTADFPRPQREG